MTFTFTFNLTFSDSPGGDSLFVGDGGSDTFFGLQPLSAIPLGMLFPAIWSIISISLRC